MPTVSILITGSEILDGRVLDTNSHLIIDKLTEGGFQVPHTLSCGDDRHQISSCLNFLLQRSDAVILSGGMGPTADDLTREVLADLAGQALELDKKVLEGLQTLYAARGRAYDSANDKQALFPRGATVIPNPVGTAAGFVIELKDWPHKPVVALPGVPGELRAMMEPNVLRALAERLLPQAKGALPKLARREMRIFGLPESVVGAKVVGSKLPKDLLVSYRAAFPEVHVVLKAPRVSYDERIVENAFASAVEGVGREVVVSRSLEVTLDQVVHGLLKERSETLALAESCTGGMLGEFFTVMPGSSESFMGGVVTYSNAAKVAMLGVSSGTIERHGAVSFEVAREMAQGARRTFSSTYALSVTGIAGPAGGSSEKPVGTFYVGLSSPAGVTAFKCFFASTRQRIRRFATFTAADILRRHLLKLPVRWEESSHAG